MSPSSTPTTLFVCTTSHIDWDWITDFEQYYALGLDYDGSADNPVRYSFDQMFALLAGRASSGFCFSLAEMGYFRRYFVDTPAAAAQTLAAGSSLTLMGGGVTSPDNLLSHGEAFIRTYLLGVQWLTSLGLIDAATPQGGSWAPLAWLPDDFGHDPQLPVVLAAMGLQAVGFSRVPGSWQGTPDAKPVEGTDTTSLAAQLASTYGLVFPWSASDGSKVLAHFMPQTYSVSSGSLGQFVQLWSQSRWGGANMFVPVPGGDFATPTTQIAQDVANYNSQRQSGDPVAQLGTFQGFVAAVLATPGTLPSPYAMDASNYWTGQFGSRPQLKIDHHASVRSLLAAEAASALLRMASTLATSVLDALDASIDQTWWSLAASTHHDFITGTSPDQTYRVEQLPLSTQTRRLARTCRAEALDLLATVVKPTPASSEIPIVVFNALGFERGGLVEIDDVATEIATVRVGDTATVAAQRSADNQLLFVMPSVPSLGYACAYLQPGTYTPPPTPPIGTELTLDNGALAVTFDGTQGWAIQSMIDKTTNTQVIAAGQHANVLSVYCDNGNLYQFGNEPIIDDTTTHTVTFGKFEFKRAITQVVSATLVENGPARWRFVVQLTDPTSKQNYEVVYTLVANEPFVRITVTGRAPDNESSIVTVSQFGSGTTLPDGLTRGTAYHWDNIEPVRYWWGPTFQATHDYLLPTLGGNAIGAVYHGGMPAWCRDRGDKNGNGVGPILGVLFRSADGTQRGAAGTDPDIHTQRFAFGGPGLGLDPSTCTPLENGLTFSTPLRARRLTADTAIERNLPATLSLAAVTGQGLIRAARVQPGSGGTTASPSPVTTNGAPIGVVLRVYTPTNSTQPTTLTVGLPALTQGATIDASLVTALELPFPTGGLPLPTSSIASTTGNQVTLDAATAITTLRIVTQRPFVQPTNGKD